MNKEALGTYAEWMIIMPITNSGTATLRIVRLVLLVILNIIVYALIILGVGKLCTTTYQFTYQVFGDTIVDPPPGLDVEFVINKGETAMSLATKLEQNRLVKNKYSFYIRARLVVSDKKPIMPGKYLLNSSMTYDEILEIITNYSAEERQNTDE